ncbi:MAG: DNA translocase FtsK, partial [Oscillospiraceae bacterium]|nr:DNA translocase FtsK [Oscillospiraceae bacterium]
SVCAFLLPVIVGAMVHLIGGQDSVGASDFVRTIFDRGMHLTSGGLISGSLAQILEQFPGAIISVILLLACLFLELITTLNMTVGGIIKAIKNRPRVQYDAPKREHRDPAEKIVEHITNVQQAQVERRRVRASDFDIPIDDELPEPQPKRTKKTTVQETAITAQPEPAEEHKERMESLLEEFETLDAAKKMPPLVVETPKAEQPPLVVPLDPAAQAQPEKIKKEEVQQEAQKIAQEIQEQELKPVYQFPSIDLLNQGTGSSVNGTEEMRQNAERLSDTLTSFGIEAQIINVTRGPSVTRYELELNRGVKLSKVTNLADDIALSLGASGVRIAAIPDKISVVGIEVPNRAVSTVFAREVIDSSEFQKNKSKISFAVGKDIGGSHIVGDIAKLPHMLIAGTTGSGKSVCMNSLIISLLYKAKPEEVKLIMVDPKMVELGIYNGIPHLLIPVVTDPKKAAGALQWAVTEMMRRYRMMADLEVHDLKSYNEAVKKSDTLEPMPQIVVVIDELADLMLVAAKDVEESICRIAQMGRASGIHLVIATQRPSADVITGLMKANIPSRIAFAVASAMES